MKKGNNLAMEAMKRHPARFSAFAAFPLADPQAAIAEFERAMTKFGFVGGFLAGTINGEFLDNKKFWPVSECVQAHDAPIYLHPYFSSPGADGVLF